MEKHSKQALCVQICVLIQDISSFNFYSTSEWVNSSTACLVFACFRQTRTHTTKNRIIHNESWQSLYNVFIFSLELHYSLFIKILPSTTASQNQHLQNTYHMSKAKLIRKPRAALAFTVLMIQLERNSLTSTTVRPRSVHLSTIYSKNKTQPQRKLLVSRKISHTFFWKKMTPVLQTVTSTSPLHLTMKGRFCIQRNKVNSPVLFLTINFFFNHWIILKMQIVSWCWGSRLNLVWFS